MPSGMKKIFVTKLTDVKTTDVEGVGTIRFEGNKVYKWITYSEEAAAVEGFARVEGLTGQLGKGGVDVLQADQRVGAASERCGRSALPGPQRSSG